MTVQVAYWVICDGCGDPVLPGGDFFPVAVTVTEARAQAKGEGFHHEHRKGSLPPLDLCPDCCLRLGWREEDMEAMA